MSGSRASCRKSATPRTPSPLSLPARSTWADTSFSGVAASACIGSLPNNINGATAETDFLATTFGGSWSFVGSTDSTGFGPFSSNPSGATSGTLNFDSAVSGRIVIGLKAANQHSFYYFDLAAPVTSLSFDTTAGIATNVRGNAQNLSHAILYAGSPLPVPEPAEGKDDRGPMDPTRYGDWEKKGLAIDF